MNKRMIKGVAAGVMSAGLMVAAGSASAVPVFNPGNGHYYEFIATPLSFDGALAAASSLTYLGNQGYLATVTSAAEQNFIFNNVTAASTWFAGTDRGTEGDWKWVAGPEAGQTFWLNGVTTIYANWSGGEPNNCCGSENFLYGNWSGSAWNDIGATQLGYTVEYSVINNTVPEPAHWMLLIAGLGAMGIAMRRRKDAKASS
jgi:hypothetical protein